jgi:hypothetical protein
MDYFGPSFKYDPFGGLTIYASEACYKKFERRWAGSFIRRDFTIQLSGGLSNCDGEDRYADFLFKLKKTCVTKIISYDTPEFMRAIRTANAAGAGWKATDILIERTGDYYNWNVNDPTDPVRTKHKCNLISVVRGGLNLLERIDVFYHFDVPSASDWDTLSDSEKAKRSYALSRIEEELQRNGHLYTSIRDVELLFRRFLPALDFSVRYATSEEIDQCRQNVIEAEVLLWQMSMGLDGDGLPFHGFIIDEPSPGNPRLKEYYDALVALRNSNRALFNNGNGKSVLMIDHYKYYDDLRSTSDFVYSDYYDDYWMQGGPETDDIIREWANNNIDGAYLHLNEWLHRYKSSGSWTDRLNYAEFDKAIEAAKNNRLVNLLIFIDSLRDMTCDTLLDALAAICSKLNDHNWFTDRTADISTYSYKYCIHYPDCYKCPKQNEELWTEDKPEGFPEIDPRSKVILVTAG